LNRPARIVVVALLIGGLGAVAVCRRRAADEAEDTERLAGAAARAMAELNQGNDDLAVWFPSAMRDVTGTMLRDPAGASRQMSTDVLRRLDAYLLSADRALAAADAYQARKPDTSVQSALDTIRRRTAAMHELRNTLAAVRDDLARDNVSQADLERIASTLSSAAIQLAIAN